MPPHGVRNRDWQGTTEPLPPEGPKPARRRHKGRAGKPHKWWSARDPRTGMTFLGTAGRRTLPEPPPEDALVPPWLGPSHW